MQTYISRNIEKELNELREIFPVVAIVGTRQVGKSTLAKYIGEKEKKFIYIDLESPRDTNKLNDPELFFDQNKESVICIDEIQRMPKLFPVLRSIIDKQKENGKLILLGSASPDLIKHSSETLAGRIAYCELSGFTFPEIREIENFDLFKLWLRGGFPLSYMQKNDKASILWRRNFVRTLIERDFPNLGIFPKSLDIRRLLTMLAHTQGQTLNFSKLGDSLGVSYHTVQKYISILEHLYIVRSLLPFEANVKKRLTKAPKVYIRDSGILHSLLDIENFNDLMGHPVYGSSWEGFALENILSNISDMQVFFYRTATGVEADLIMQKGKSKILVEFKASTAPKLTRSFHTAVEDINPEHSYIVCPIDEKYQLNKNVTVCGIGGLPDLDVAGGSKSP